MYSSESHCTNGNENLHKHAKQAVEYDVPIYTLLQSMETDVILSYFMYNLSPIDVFDIPLQHECTQSWYNAFKQRLNF